ncbi:hypothetical protein EXS71_01450 [Candidatus Uhrbacteria bacterium]|nr:hypothetical protein [Candidatus Uhrbacteria bacterium]
MSKEQYQPTPDEMRAAEQSMSHEQRQQSNTREQNKHSEALAKILLEHPEVLTEILKTPLTPEMLVVFAQNIETPSGNVFVTYEKIDGSAHHDPCKTLKLWIDEPRFNGGLVVPGLSSALVKSETKGKVGFGGIGDLPKNMERALATLENTMKLIKREESEIQKLSRFDEAQAALYVFRTHDKKKDK